MRRPIPLIGVAGTVRRGHTNNFAGSLAALLLCGGMLVSRSDAQTLEVANAAEHAAFVDGTFAACTEACPARVKDAVSCEETCACVGEQMSARISPDDLRAMYLAEQKSSREEAMAPYLQTMLMGYNACGFPLD